MPPSDSRYELAQARSYCYDLVLDSLKVFEEKCKDAPTSGTDEAAFDAPESVRSHAYELAFASEDEMFHSTFYDWLIGRDLADDLLAVQCILLWPMYPRLTMQFIDETPVPRSLSSPGTCYSEKV